ncbi:hypothetical protein G647_07727 [Cladophialophora carrionii CBS 160.54]|uniref:Uncharacterized protein n=1 Tax=Cladophialophora carrionii CBS 160.54 TaxID=1279043 RepID=V9D3F5_9EURO|nr:uncharacterized protein G647_07727 [Cladophialophora carrionii CBS 160.54]ETI21380.1 hypothetical protein G647_07727 [Cladophialophora carrionii CBS 160.54]
MQQASPKRRKLDHSQSATIDDTGRENGQPTTPTRASYLSPTKSSLARSHPHLITRSNRRSATEPRGKALRDEILSATTQPVQAPKTVSQIQQSQRLDAADDPAPRQGNEGASETHLDHTAEESAVGANSTQRSERDRLPLNERQPTQDRRRERSTSDEDPAPPIILPQLVSRKELSARPLPRGLSGEPDLPPTPIELGLSPAPERPRGLASSSSPRSSNMSRSSKRQRTRSGAPITSSPLKTKAPQAAKSDNEEAPDEEATEEDVQEAPESEPVVAHQENVEDPTVSDEQHSTLRSLQGQLEQLRQDCQHLQKAIDDDNNLSEETLAILRQSLLRNDTLRISKSGKEGDNFSTYLTLFAPANLQLTSHTETKLIKDRTKIIHRLKVEAPPPWLPNALFCVFEVAIDAENAQIEHVELNEVMLAVTRRTKSNKAEIYRWVHDRLEHPLHRLDVSGLVWGMGRWFNAAVERAKVFRWIDLKYKRLQSDVTGQVDVKDEGWNRETCIELARYLDSTQNSAIDVDVIETTGGKKYRKKLMLTWKIDLDWAGGLTSNIQISASGIPLKAEPGLKTIFCSLVPRVGVKGAFENVWSVIHSEAEEYKFDSAKGKGKKRRGNE